MTRAVPGLYPVVGSLTVDAVEQHAADWQPVDGATDPTRWQPVNPAVQGLDEPVEKISAGLRVGYAAPPTISRIGVQAAAPGRLPAVVTTAYAPPPGTRALVLDMPSGAPLDVDAVRTVSVLPRAGDRGVLIDLDQLVAARPYGYADLLPNEVWLAASAPADLPDRLAAAGVTVTGVSSTQQRERVLRHEGPALSVTLMLAGAGAAAVLAAAGAVVNLHVMGRRRAFELAAMRSLGVRRVSMAAAVGAEQAVLIGFAIVLGVALGVLGARLALPAIPEYADLPSYPDLLIRLDPWLVAGVAGGFAALLGSALLVSGYVLLRAAVPSRLREAQA
jgi:putative ABC transport system permease protein